MTFEDVRQFVVAACAGSCLASALITRRYVKQNNKDNQVFLDSLKAINAEHARHMRALRNAFPPIDPPEPPCPN
jgi:hypothetical protein